MNSAFLNFNVLDKRVILYFIDSCKYLKYLEVIINNHNNEYVFFTLLPKRSNLN